MDKLTSSPATPQGGQGYNPYSAQAPSPYHTQGYGNVGASPSGHQWPQQQQPSPQGHKKYGHGHATQAAAGGQGPAAGQLGDPGYAGIYKWALGHEEW